MVAMYITRKFDELGRLTLPLEVRKNFDINVGDEIKIFIDEEQGNIILKKAYDKCLRCQTRENLKEIKSGFCLCSTCIEEINK